MKIQSILFAASSMVLTARALPTEVEARAVSASLTSYTDASCTFVSGIDYFVSGICSNLDYSPRSVRFIANTIPADCTLSGYTLNSCLGSTGLTVKGATVSSTCYPTNKNSFGVSQVIRSVRLVC